MKKRKTGRSIQKRKELDKKIKELKDYEKQFSDKRITRLFRLSALFTTFLVILTTLVVTLSKPHHFVDLSSILNISIIRLIILLLYILLFLYWLNIILSLVLELHNSVEPSENEAYNEFREWVFRSVHTSPLQFVLHNLLFGITPVLSIILIVLPIWYIQLIGVGLLIIFVVTFLFFFKKLFPNKESANGRNKSLIEKIVYVVILVIVVLLTLILIWAIIFSTSGIKINFDKDYYYQGDTINLVIEPYGFFGTKFLAVKYLGGEALTSTPLKGEYYPVTIPPSKLNLSWDVHFLTVEYKLSIIPMKPFFDDKITKKVYIPFFENKGVNPTNSILANLLDKVRNISINVQQTLNKSE